MPASPQTATVPAGGTMLTISNVSSEKTYVVGVCGVSAAGNGEWTSSVGMSASAVPNDVTGATGSTTLKVSPERQISWSYLHTSGDVVRSH